MAGEPECLQTRPISEIDPKLQQRDAGEREAITLALTTSATLVLLDERNGRRAARERGLAVSGTLGVLDLATRRGFVSMSDALERLQRTNFRASPRLIARIRERSSE